MQLLPRLFLSLGAVGPALAVGFDLLPGDLLHTGRLHHAGGVRLIPFLHRVPLVLTVTLPGAIVVVSVAHLVQVVSVLCRGIDREATVAMVVVHVLTSVIDAIGQAIDLHMAVGMTRRIATGIDMIVLLAVLDLAAGLGLTILEDIRLHRLALPFQGFRL